jgi:hypothetical protein
MLKNKKKLNFKKVLGILKQMRKRAINPIIINGVKYYEVTKDGFRGLE